MPLVVIRGCEQPESSDFSQSRKVTCFCLAPSQIKRWWKPTDQCRWSTAKLSNLFHQKRLQSFFFLSWNRHWCRFFFLPFSQGEFVLAQCLGFPLHPLFTINTHCAKIMMNHSLVINLTQNQYNTEQSSNDSKIITSLCLTSMVWGKRSSATWLCKSVDSCTGNGRTSSQQGHFLSAAGKEI